MPLLDVIRFTTLSVWSASTNRLRIFNQVFDQTTKRSKRLRERSLQPNRNCNQPISWWQSPSTIEFQIAKRLVTANEMQQNSRPNSMILPANSTFLITVGMMSIDKPTRSHHAWESLAVASEANLKKPRLLSGS